MAKKTNAKTWVIISVVLVGVLAGGVRATGNYDGGDGSSGNPFQINTPVQMDEIGQHSEDWGSYFILTADIDLSAFTGAAFHIIGNDATSFTGFLNGNGHTISNFTYIIGDKDYVGLFGYIGWSGEIKNLDMVEVNVNAGWGHEVGGLVGYNYGTTISNCHATGTVTGDYAVGGLVGRNMYGTVLNCSAGGNVTQYHAGSNWAGGLVGYNFFGTISNCYSTATVSGGIGLGGLVGINHYLPMGGSYFATISNCYATGTVTGNSTVGGLVAYNSDAAVSNCYATGTVTGSNRVGGLVGENDDRGGIVSNCYATGSVTGTSDVGGLVGYNDSTVTASFWDIDTSGQATSAGGTGKTTAQMQTQSTFTNAGWNFINIWDIIENVTYPFLVVFEPYSPTADAGSDQTYSDDDDDGTEQVTLDGSGSYDPDGPIVSWIWTDDLGDTIPNVENPIASLGVGIHTITLMVVDNDGLTDTDTVVITINAPPVANAGPDQTDTDYDGNGSESITLDGSGSDDVDGTIVSWVWTDNLVDPIPDGEITTADLSVGIHTITLTVTDNDGAVSSPSDTVVVTVNPRPAMTIYVDDDAPNDPVPGDPSSSDPLEDGSPEHPFDAIQEGIDDAVDGDTVQVAAGTYYENITLRDGVAVIGDGPLDTTIDGGAAGSVVTSVDCGPDTALERFTVTNGEAEGGGGVHLYNSSPTITNCTISNNFADASPFSNGGGMFSENSSPTITNCTFSGNLAWNNSRGGGIHNVSSSPTITNCTFISNSAPFGSGGGIYNSSSSPTITNCIFSGNSSPGGGGMYNYSGNPTITDCIFNNNSADQGGGMQNYSSNNSIITKCTFSGNTASSRGGGMFNRFSSSVVTNCTFSGNSTDGRGGGMGNDQRSNSTVTNCTFISNSAPSGNGGGMHNYYFCNPTVTNCIFADNTGGVNNTRYCNPTITNCTFTGNSGSVILNSDHSVPIFVNCILWDDSATEIEMGTSDSGVVLSYCDIQGGWAGGIGNIDADPCFVDPGYWADVNNPNIVVEPNDPNAVWVDGDYHLQVVSPCIDVGDNNSVPADTADLDNDGNTAEPIPWDLDGRNRFADGDCNDSNVVDMGAYEFAWVYIGDFDGQCDVDFADWAIFALAWLTEQGQPGYNPACDISLPADNRIDWADVKILCDNWLAEL